MDDVMRSAVRVCDHLPKGHLLFHRADAPKGEEGGENVCLTADEVNPLCDECLARLKMWEGPGEFEPCECCKGFLEGLCMCCYTRYDPPEEGGIEDGVCRECRAETDGKHL